MTTHTAFQLLDRLASDLARPLPSAPAAVSAVPVDVVEHEDRFEVLADLPGVAESDVEVEVIEGELHIRGERKAAAEEGRVRRRERRLGRLHRVLGLGEEVEVDRITASFRDGVLRLVLPKAERLRPRQIPISVN